MKLKYYHWILIALFVLTLGSRLFFAFQTPTFTYDAYDNLRQVEHITETGLPLYNDDLSYGGKINYFPPFFHYFLAFFNLFLPIGIVGKIIPNLLISFLVVIVFFITDKISKNKSAALFAAFISSFIPVMFAETINSVSELTLVVPLVFLALYCLMNVQEKKFLYTYLVIVVLLSITHASSFFLILGLLLYLVISEAEIIKRNRAETELILFSTFVFLWIQSLFYKKAFLMHGVSLIWENMPAALIASIFSEATILGMITKIGWLPFFYGIYLIFKYILKEKNKYIYMYISMAVPVMLLLWLRWIEPCLGLIFLGVSLSILFSEFYNISWSYFKRTKISKWRWVFAVSLTVTFILTSVVPAVYLAKNNIHESVPRNSIEAFTWLAEQDGEVVLASLDEGHLITYLSKKKNVWDNNFLFFENSEERVNEASEIYTTQSRIKAIELLDKYKVDFIVISNKVKEEHQIKKLSFRDESCIRKVYRGDITIYQNNCRVKTLAI